MNNWGNLIGKTLDSRRFYFIVSNPLQSISLNLNKYYGKKQIAT